jgi:bzd-type benzoyl-CoA reductase N subunit
MDKIAELRTIVDHPYSYLQKLKDQTGQKIVGTVCSYAPEELIFAAGALPVRLFGSDSGIHRADLHLQSYCCSLVRGILEEALSGRLDLLDGMVFPHTCDSIQRLSDVWRLNLVKPFHADVVLPVKLSTPSARQYLLDVLKKFKTDLERGLAQEITEANLIHAVKIYNAIRALMTRLYQLRCENPQVLKGQDFHTIIRAAMIMEREAFLEDLAAILSELTKTASEKKPSHAKRLVLSGGICSSPDIYDAIEDADGVVVGDDLCTGSRYFESVINENLPPLTAIAQRYAERASCPAKHAGLTNRGEGLVKMVKDCRADGVVFLLLKFCDPHAFDYPYIKDMLDREKIPTLLLEIEEQTQAGGQLQTRMETFIQIL